MRASFTGDPASSLVAVVAGIMYADDPRVAAITWRDRIRRAAEQPVAQDERGRLDSRSKLTVDFGPCRLSGGREREDLTRFRV